MLGSAESEMVRLISRKLFQQNSNLYDHDTSTSQTDGRTDGRTTCHGNTALRVASRGNKSCKSCRTCCKFYCMFYFTCDRSLIGNHVVES